MKKHILILCLIFSLLAGAACASQAPIVIPNGSGAQVRGWINDALMSLATLFSGPGDPATTYAYMLKANTATGYLEQRNATNTAWNTVRPLDPSIPLSTGAAGTYAVAYNPAITSYKEGVIYPFKADKNSVVGTNYLNINGIGAKIIIIPTAFIIGNIYYLYYDLANDRFLVVNSAIDPPWVDYSSVSTINGWSYFVSKFIFYKKVGTIVYVKFTLQGPSNNIHTSFTLPFAPFEHGLMGLTALIQTEDNSILGGIGNVQTVNTNVFNLWPDVIQSNWSATGVKGAWGQFFYEVAP